MHPPLRFPIRSLLDKIGATGSLLCAVHCALLPLVLALLPELGLDRWLGHTFDFVFLVFATLVGASSLVSGWRRHGEVHALRLLAVGLVVLWTSVLYPPLHDSRWLHALLMTCGGALVGIAHMLNLRLNHRHAHGVRCAH